jgi:hypothetical protein
MIVGLENSSLLHPQQYLSLAPQLFQFVIIALVGREDVHDHIAVVYHQPAIAGFALFTAFFLVLLPHAFQDCFGQGVQHAVAGAVAEHEVVGERGNAVKIEQ